VPARRAAVVWRPCATLATLLSLTAALALTVTPVPGGLRMGLSACIPYDWNDLLFNILYSGGGMFTGVLNLVLLVPLAASLVLPAVAVGALLPLLIELAQTQLPGRGRMVADWLANSTGAGLGAAVGGPSSGGCAGLHRRSHASGEALGHGCTILVAGGTFPPGPYHHFWWPG